MIRDQPFGRRDEIVEHVLLVFALATTMPCVAELCAAAEICECDNASRFDPGDRQGPVVPA